MIDAHIHYGDDDPSFEMHLAYLSGSGQTMVRSYATQGLALPAAVLDKVYTENAQHWYPRL